MEMVDAIRERRSIRVFLPDPVPCETLGRLFDVARWAPSGSNRQPWRVSVVSGGPLRVWREALAARVPGQWDEDRQLAFDRRVRAGSLASLFSTGSRAPFELLVVGSHRLYDAPAAIVLSFSGQEGDHRPDAIAAFVTTMMLAAPEMGLGTCWLGFALAHPDLVCQHARLSEGEQPAAVIAVGYPSPDAPENQFRSSREPVEAFVRWVDGEGDGRGRS